MYFSAREFYDAARQGHVIVHVPIKEISDNVLRMVYNRPNATREYIQRIRQENSNAVVGVPRDVVTLQQAAKYLRRAKKAILNRTYNADGIYIPRKWHRPWRIVPSLANWRPPEGDFGVGVEIEMGFRRIQDAAYIANKCSKMKYVTADHEGGSYPIEMTFPPTRYSKLNNRSAVMRYIDLLNNEVHRVVRHAANECVGTHINVSVPSGQRLNWPRLRGISNELNYSLTWEEKRKYFGRGVPYGYINSGDCGDHYCEMKMFNSTIDKVEFKRYIHIAVELVKLAQSNETISRNNVIAALERGYNKKSFKV